MDVLSFEFLFLLYISSFLYWIINNKYKNPFLIVLSVLFILSYGYKKLMVVLIYVVITYFLSCIKRKSVLTVFLCLIPLLFNKYYEPMMSFFNLEKPINNELFNILGISYISFKAISYIIDKRKGIIENDSFADYCLYMFYFPTLLSGPIEKYNSFIKQIKSEKKFSENQFVYSVLLFTYGYFMKKVIADRLFILIDNIFLNCDKYGFFVLIGVLLYSIYIYCDFSGYSNIALGMSLLFGINITDNFNSPLLSTSVKSFWNRWHISLNNWLRDYIYIPLGGNRKGDFRKHVNILIVFLVSGIWHGVGIGFVIWGLLNGLYQVLEGLLFDRRKKREYCKKNIVNVIYVYLLISTTWIFFNRNFESSINIIRSIFMIPKCSLNVLLEDIIQSGFFHSLKLGFIIIILSILIVMIVDICKIKECNLLERVSFMPRTRWIILLLFIISVILFGCFDNGNDASKFIYFDF